MTSDYIYVRGVTAYLLDEYLPEATAEELIAASTSAAHITQVSLKGMKKKRYVGTDIVYGHVDKARMGSNATSETGAAQSTDSRPSIH